MKFIKGRKLVYDYIETEENNEETILRAIKEIDLDVEEGEFVAVLGHNGSGKSTLAKHLNVLLKPTGGTLWINGKDTSDQGQKWAIREETGMVFQNPDNQIIANVVEEDVAFGPENIGIPTDEIWQRVNYALQTVGMDNYRYHSPNRLSGGQKQRVAIAGVVAMKPKCIVLDEPTAMLDPNGRKEVLDTVRKLNKLEQVTVVLITHHMDEVLFADKVIVMDDGKIVMQGTPKEVFSRVEDLKRYSLDVPQITELAYQLQQSGLDLPDGIITIEELVSSLNALKKSE